MSDTRHVFVEDYIASSEQSPRGAVIKTVPLGAFRVADKDSMTRMGTKLGLELSGNASVIQEAGSVAGSPSATGSCYYCGGMGLGASMMCRVSREMCDYVCVILSVLF